MKLRERIHIVHRLLRIYRYRGYTVYSILGRDDITVPIVELFKPSYLKGAE
jgi:acetolactate synthase regulatory subunit